MKKTILFFDEKDTYFIKIYDTQNPTIEGWGEAALFRGLSADDTPEFTNILDDCCASINDIDINANTFICDKNGN